MAYTGQTAALLANYISTLALDDVERCINRSFLLGQILNFKPYPGQGVKFPVAFGDESKSTANIADGADVETFNTDTKLFASYDYATMHDAIALSDKQIAAAMNSSNPQELINLVVPETVESVQRLAKRVSRDCYIGTGAATHILGFLHTAGGSPAGALQATGTYFGIDRATYSQWRPTVKSNGGVARELTFPLMDEFEAGIFALASESPDVYLAGPRTHAAYARLFDTRKEYQHEIYLRGQKIVLSGGHVALEYAGKPLLRDNDCPEGTIVALNTEYVDLTQLPPAAGEATLPLAGTAEGQTGAGASRLVARVKSLAENGAHKKTMIDCWPQLVVRKPYTCGQLTDLIYA